MVSFPKSWPLIINNNESDYRIDIRYNIPIAKKGVTNSRAITVKSIRSRILKTPANPVFTFESKLNIVRNEQLNPFIINRMANKSEHMRMIKFRFLHCDIFSKQRMFKFKMCESDRCDYCGNVETIRHLIWECERAKRVWETLNNFLRACGIDQVIDYSSLYTGINPINLVIEILITKVTQLILQIDRSNLISEQKLKSEIIFLSKMYKDSKDRNSWEIIMNACSNL